MTKPAVFAESEREQLLAVKGIGPTVVARLQEIGITSFAELANRDPDDICAHVSRQLGASCWRNSPQSRAAIASAVALANASL